MASSYRTREFTLNCEKCSTKLAKKEILMLATMPPSQYHLSVKEDMEVEAYKKVRKVENSGSRKSRRYCPYLIYCRECGTHVGNVTHLASKLLICYKVENIDISNGVENIKMGKVSRMIDTFQYLGIEMIKYLPDEVTGKSRQISVPMKYCDITGLTDTSEAINCLTSQNPRGYQRELFLAVMRGNTLIYLPTGSGKTLVAAMVFSCMKQLNPSKLMVFLVDRVPLAYQQSAYFKSQLPHMEVRTLTGEMIPFLKKNVYQGLDEGTVDILVLTHQILLDSLESSIILLSNISVLAFDEAHHCNGNHPYNKILNTFYDNTPDSFKPLVLGLTASPAGEVTKERTIEKLQKLMKNLHCKIAMPIKSGDLVAHVHTPDTKYEDVTTTNTRQVIFEKIIKDHIDHIVRSHIESKQGFQQLLKGLPPFSSNFRGALRNLIERCQGDSSTITVLIVAEHIMHLLGVIEVGQILSYRDALTHLNYCINNIVQGISPTQSVLKDLFGTEGPFHDLRKHTAENVDDDCLMSDRFTRLENQLRQFISRVKEDPSSRGIIFVCMRKTAYKLCQKIRENAEVCKILNPAPLVGHGDGSYDGMAWKDDQEVLLEEFKSGEVKLLVTTSVLEEGLDVPICNFVVRFEGAATLRAFVQSRGRASRRPGSHFVVICTEKEKDEAIHLQEKEENMSDAVADIMDKDNSKSQAREFKCDIKPPDFILHGLSGSTDTETSPNFKRYCPVIDVVILIFEKQKDKGKEISSTLTKFLESEFNVVSTKSDLRFPEEGQSAEISFMVREKDHSNQEFRSKNEFICHVSNVWCNIPIALPMVWLHPLLPQTSRKHIEQLHVLPAMTFFLGTFVTRSQFQCEWPNDPVFKDVKLRFDHIFKMLTVFFVFERLHFKLEIRYEEFEDFLLVDSSGTNEEIIRIFFTVRHPPKLYRSIQNDDEIDNGNDNAINNNNPGDEGIDVSNMSDSDPDGFSTDDEYPDMVRNYHDRSVPSFADDDNYWERVADVAVGQDEEFEAWKQCFTFCFNIPPEEYILLRSLLNTLDAKLGKKAFYTKVENSYGSLPSIDISNVINFDIRYTLESIFRSYPSVRGRLDDWDLLDELLRNRDPHVVATCLDKLRKALERDSFCDAQQTLHRLLTENKQNVYRKHQNQVPGHCALIKRVIITPTRILVYPPEVMVKNRVLRHYESDDFLCVSVREEDLSKLSMGRGSIDLLLDSVNEILNNGLNIAGKAFQFLASSNSQLRNHSCWFVGPSFQSEDVRRWMGDFSHISCVATYMARMGQCFSTSVDTVSVQTPEEEMYVEEDDVKTADKKYTFSDGIGRISEEMAAEVSKELGKASTPSAFQIRFAGYKGVLACDPTLAGKKASFRTSMRKFESHHRRLEVTHTSRPQAVYLNHQIIMLLSNLGVPDEEFLALQKEMLDRLADMLVNESDAIPVLTNGTKGCLSFHALSNGGVQLTTEPFFKSLLVAIYRNRIHDLLSRARIRLPSDEARLMMGIMDEAALLQPGQVFIQYSAASAEDDEGNEFNLSDKRILTGPVVVTRNPCLHPGDVRQLQAVNVPRLGHLVDCIVFPQRGSRPHPNEMSGGDLDGDLYFVCWKQGLFPSKPDFPPMDYTAPEKKEEPEEITSTHMTKFLIDYIRSDQLGVIDNKHKALADQEELGVESDICLHLAELHSLAVDAPKTGKWPKIPQTNVKKYPDFMMKSDKPNYPSENVLGKLFRRCQKFKDTTSENCSQKMRIDESFLLPGNDRYIVKAKEVYQQYRDKLEALMRLYGVNSEGEIFTGCFLKLRNRLQKEKTNIAEVVSKLLLEIRSEFRREFFEEFGMDEHRLTPDAKLSNEVYLKASAWYAATYTHEENWEQLQKKRFLGLPWIVDDVMSAMITQHQSHSLAQNLNIEAAIGQSLVRLFEEEKEQLLEQTKESIRMKNAIVAYLQTLNPDLVIYFTGATRTMLFQTKSPVEFCALPKSLTGIDAGFDSEIGLKTLQPIVRHLRAKKGPFHEVFLLNKEQFPLISCKASTEKLKNENWRSLNLACELSSSKIGLLVGMGIYNFIEKYPQFLLIFRVIQKWCHGTGLYQNSANPENISNTLIILFITQCLDRADIENFEADELFQKLRRLQRGEDTDVNLCTTFEKIGTIVGKQNENQLNVTKLGEMLLLLFRIHEMSMDISISEPFSSILTRKSISQLIQDDRNELFRDHMQRAYQLLRQYGDVKIMLSCCSSEEYNVIFLSPILSFSLSGIEKSKAKEISRSCGAKSVIIRSTNTRSKKFSTLEVKGNEPAIRAVRRELEKMTVQAAGDKWSLMSGSFVDGSHLMLFEGSKSVKDIVTLTPYIGPCNQTHDGLARHLAFVGNPAIANVTNDYMFNRFTERFLQQFRLFQRDFDPELHGIFELAVHFGRKYLFSIPHSLLEDSESVSIEMLKTNKFKKGIQRKSRRVPTEINYVDQETERQLRRKKRPNKPIPIEEKKNKRKHGKPPRSSFYTVIHSPDRIKDFLRFHGFQTENADLITETCSVNIYREDVEFYVRFDNAFRFVDVRFPNLRWCVTDVKRKWKRPQSDRNRPHADSEIAAEVSLEGNEIDMRFLLQSHATLQSDKIFDTHYKEYVDILKAGTNAEKPFTVKENLWKDVRMIRLSKCKVFKLCEDVQDDFLSNLAVYLQEIKELSRPGEKPGDFKTEYSRWEVSFRIAPPENFEKKASLRKFLRRLWDFAFALSNSASEF
ncbi:uncharacterized protein LOC114515528 [Dendronephthya gigantea]|uniref:uncharacterized protein LOC114515528 n=1 Tax=Dendronephthya gigantea TaxID=151771 RepID=UPI0010698140|nr:uncharacterized protein LOC114515528 [Dendronephthya gigantea]XP_028390592.1 uncharacterized protein LOC114515528 [Dendronephthya gigantea]